MSSTQQHPLHHAPAAGDRTKLALEVPDIPWRTDFALGAGIDALTGKLTDNALVPGRRTT